MLLCELEFQSPVSPFCVLSSAWYICVCSAGYCVRWGLVHIVSYSNEIKLHDIMIYRKMVNKLLYEMFSMIFCEPAIARFVINYFHNVGCMIENSKNKLQQSHKPDIVIVIRCIMVCYYYTTFYHKVAVIYLKFTIINILLYGLRILHIAYYII